MNEREYIEYVEICIHDADKALNNFRDNSHETKALIDAASQIRQGTTILIKYIFSNNGLNDENSITLEGDNEKIDYLLSKGYINKNQAYSLHVSRKLGNQGAHVDWNIKKSDVENGISALKQVSREIFNQQSNKKNSNMARNMVQQEMDPFLLSSNNIDIVSKSSKSKRKFISSSDVLSVVFGIVSLILSTLLTWNISGGFDTEESIELFFSGSFAMLLSAICYYFFIMFSIAGNYAMCVIATIVYGVEYFVLRAHPMFMYDSFCQMRYYSDGIFETIKLELQYHLVFLLILCAPIIIATIFGMFYCMVCRKKFIS